MSSKSMTENDTNLPLPILYGLSDIVTRQAAIRPNKTALIFEEQNLTYASLDKGANRVANGLLSLGLKPDERVGYLGKNSHFYYELLFGTCRAAGVLCPINWRLALPEILYVLNDSKPRILFVGIEFVEMIPDLLKGVSSIEHVIPMETTPNYDEHYAIWRDGFDSGTTGISRGGLDDAIQIYTSGTTGFPKGATLSHKSITTAYERYRNAPIPAWNVWSDEDVSLIPMPCFHIGGTAWGLTTMAHGGTGVVMRNFIPTDVLGYIDKYKISKLFLVPAALQIVINQEGVRNVDFSQMKFMFYGASPMPLALLEKAIDIFGCGFTQFYGMTETSGSITALPPEDHDVNGNERMRSVGKPLLGVEIQIWDEKGNVLSPGKIGEITTRSTMNMNGYFEKFDATAETINPDGWLKTGDLGYLDADGYLFLKDRKKDMIISGGENIYPAEVENALYDHPKILEAAVIGVPDEKWGETVKAYIVIEKGQSLEADELIAWSKTRLAKYKCPKSVEFMETLPRNPSGKVLRRKLRENYKDKSD